MPSASNELQDRMIARFGSLDDAGPAKYLTDRGYVLSKDWTWSRADLTVDYKSMSRDEFECLLFLCHEHDYGGGEVSVAPVC